MSQARRTVRTAHILVETQGMSEIEHIRRVSWVEKNLLNANANVDGAFVAVIIKNDDDENTKFSGSGTPTQETSDLIEELVAE